METGFNRFATVSEASSGIRADKALSFNVQNKFEWRDPPVSGVIGKIWPTEATYHPLLNNTNYEIAYTMAAIEGEESLSAEEKDMYKRKVKDIVVDAPGVIYRGRAYLCGILVVVCLLLILVSSGGLNTLLWFIIAGLTVGVFYYMAKSVLFAPAEGLENWSNFSNEFSAAINSGKTISAILDGFRASDDRRAEARMMADRGTNSGSWSFLGALLGSQFRN